MKSKVLDARAPTNKGNFFEKPKILCYEIIQKLGNQDIICPFFGIKFD